MCQKIARCQRICQKTTSFLQSWSASPAAVIVEDPWLKPSWEALFSSYLDNCARTTDLLHNLSSALQNAQPTVHFGDETFKQKRLTTTFQPKRFNQNRFSQEHLNYENKVGVTNLVKSSLLQRFLQWIRICPYRLFGVRPNYFNCK